MCLNICVSTFECDIRVCSHVVTGTLLSAYCTVYFLADLRWKCMFVCAFWPFNVHCDVAVVFCHCVHTTGLETVPTGTNKTTWVEKGHAFSPCFLLISVFLCLLILFLFWLLLSICVLLEVQVNVVNELIWNMSTLSIIWGNVIYTTFRYYRSGAVVTIQN
jgi:hypothetical protein